jgi:predicted enzyme related to lactoylglutathione lyase
MVKSVAHQPGAFCFVESGSADIESSSRFYEGLFGWEVDKRTLPDGGTYARFLMRGGPVAGMYAVEADDDVMGVPSQWLSYVSVVDAVATLDKAVALGATAFGDVVEVPGVVTVAEFSDPAGAVCGLWQPGAHIGASYVVESGALAWNDLLTPEPIAAASFYCSLFDWTLETVELRSSSYHLFRCGDNLRGGMMNTSANGEDHSSWRAHIGVEDLDAATTKVIELDGHIDDDAIHVPGFGRRAAVNDPAGISFMLIETTPHN